MLAEAAGSVATPQIRNVGTLAGNVCQRPWCWYFRNGFPCFKAGGNHCFSFAGENQFHAIFGGGPSYIVHPSDTAPALVALDAKFRIVGPSGERTVPAADFFVLPRQNPARENVLADDEIAGVGARCRRRGRARAARITRCWTARRGRTRSSAPRSCCEMDGDVCRSARVVLGGVAPIPWRLPEVEQLLAGQRITEDARRAGRRSRRRRRASAREERLQGAADEESGPPDGSRSGAESLASPFWAIRSIRHEPPRVSSLQTGITQRMAELSCERLYMRLVNTQRVSARTDDERGGRRTAGGFRGAHDRAGVRRPRARLARCRLRARDRHRMAGLRN